MITLLLLAALAAEQAPATFEVASIKTSTGPDYAARIYPVNRGGPGTADPGLWNCDHLSLAELVRTAYQLQDFQYSGPAWMERDYFAITAKVPPGITREQFRAMLQNLLVERFRMVVRREPKEVAGYEMTVAKDGPKLRESPPLAEGAPEIPSAPRERPRVVLGPDGYPVLPPGLAATMTMGFRARRQAIRESMDQLARNLSGSLHKPVADATGLKGKYDFTLSYIYDGPGAPAMPPPGNTQPLPPAMDPSGPTLIRAVQEQLGLRLDAKKVAVDFVTVERAERTPLEN